MRARAAVGPAQAGYVVPVRRWDGDERHIGLTSGSAMEPEVRELLEEMRRDRWVAEAPEAHLLPHLRRACGSEWLLVGERLLEDGVYEVTVSLAGDREGVNLHRDAIRLLSAIAESVFFVRQRAPDVFECVTGILHGDRPGFAGHGHLVRLIVK